MNSLQVALAGDEPPDASFTNGTEIPFLAFNEALLPLDDLVSDEDKADFMADLLEMVSFNNHRFIVAASAASFNAKAFTTNPSTYVQDVQSFSPTTYPDWLIPLQHQRP